MALTYWCETTSKPDREREETKTSKKVSTAQTSVQSRAPSRQQDNPPPSSSAAAEDNGGAVTANNSAVSGNGPADSAAGLQPDSLEDQPRGEVTAENTDSEDDDTEEVAAGRGGWGATAMGAQSRAASPPAGSETSSIGPPMPQRYPQANTHNLDSGTGSRYANLSYWKARRVLFYRNGDPYFPGVEFRFKPGRDIATLESLLDKLSLRMDLPRGARYVFSMDGDRKYSLDELEDGASYVCSSYKTFKN
ncbi:echinoderm microtubule-associated protein-like CG42247 [Ctenocephalides felis]|uniref:echinoderm microtubule-associated protein-like CG42247 n=1 Tax=Ctenocephalides felis TaxID=7515 RepID=UPI000E6E1740|nr:echinoderm microtubule-associated protein-like CG42247 [Ctenocephalides felis]